MANGTSEDELDDILDDALEAFDTSRKAASIPAAKCGDEGASSTGKAGDESSSADEAPPEVSVEAAKAFEDALKALGDFGLDENGNDDDVSEADMKLVEDFMRSIGSSFGGMDGPRPKGNAAGAGQSAGAGQAGASGGIGAGTAPDVEKLVESIVGHLLSEDVLKSPMLQMRAAYAEWLPKNAEELSAEELGRYSRQQELVEEICEQYESGSASSGIMELLSKMQETGAPPAEVMKGLSMDADNSDGGLGPAMGVPEMEKMMESCGVQ